MADYTVPSTPVSGTGTTFNLPNFVGELFSLIPAQTPFLSMMGGLTGGKSVLTKEFWWSVEDNEGAAVNVARIEGDDPADKEIVRQGVSNVLEIHQESVNITYTKQAAVEQLGAGGATNAPNIPILGEQKVRGEIPHQLALKINKVARDVERSFLEGVYKYPDTELVNVDFRQTRGILTAITIHVETYATSMKDSFDALLTGMYEDEEKIAPLINPIVMVNGSTMVKLSTDYSNNLGLADRSRTVGGVNVETLITNFGTFGVVKNRYMPVDQLLLADMNVVAPCFLPIPGKGHFFTEPLAKTGAYDRVQLYGEIGLEYGPEQFHGKIISIP